MIGLFITAPGLTSVAQAHQGPAPVPSPGAMPSAVPASFTPAVDDGEVRAIAEIGSTIVIGGTFTSVDGRKHDRLAAFNESTGALVAGFNPDVNGPVYAVIPGPSAGTAYVAGDFSRVGSVDAQFLALVSTDTGAPLPSFHPPTFDFGYLNDIVVGGSRLYAAGTFSTANGVAHRGLVAMDKLTGSLDPFMGVDLTGHHNTDPGGAQGAIGGIALDINPAASKLVVVGNFKNADGLLRDQLALIDLTGSTARVEPSWATTGYAPTCKSTAYDATVRGVSFSPDGSYFVVTTSGAGNGNDLCDTATRWATDATGSDISPTWIQATGRDTVWGVTVTDTAVFVGGHNRWANNPLGLDRAQPGAVPRPGLMALDPQSGRPLAWNPGRLPLGVAVFAILATRSGIWIGSDTVYIGSREYLRPRIAFFPYSGGSTVASTHIGSLPGTVVRAGTKAAAPTRVLYRVNTGGPAIASADNGPDWQADTAASPSRYRTGGGSNVASFTAVRAVDSHVPAGTPSLLYDSERSDPAGSPEMEWKFPVAHGTSVQVRLYLSSRCNCDANQRVFSVTVDGAAMLTNEDLSNDVGNQIGTLKSTTVTAPSSGIVDIKFVHNKQDPRIDGIELVNTMGPTPTTGGSNAVATIAFNGSTGSNVRTTSGGSVIWSQARGALMTGNTVFYGSTDGYLHKVSYNGSTFGTPVKLDPYNDPAWDGIRTGDGDTTFDGWHPDFYDLLPNVTAMFYYAGRLYYTLYNDTRLYSSWFSPDSGIVDEISVTTPSTVSFAGADGMFVAYGSLYWATRADGNLHKVSFGSSGVTGTSSVVSGPSVDGVNWTNRALFLESN